MILIVRSLVFDNFHTLSADLDIELCLESDLDSQKLDIEGESTLDSSQSSISVNRLDIGPISRLDGLLCTAKRAEGNVVLGVDHGIFFVGDLGLVVS